MGLGSSPRLERNESRRPSGDQRGPLASEVGSEKRIASPSGLPPERGCSHTSRWRRFSASITRVTVKATYAPVGDIAGSDTPTMR